MYVDVFLDHLISPCNAGFMIQPDAVGKTEDSGCGSAVEISIRVRESILGDVKFIASGGPAVIATTSMITVLAKGKTLEQAMALTERDVVNALGGLFDEKVPCSKLGINALRNAIRIYQANKEGEGAGV